jgi:hypothetical protein
VKTIAHMTKKDVIIAQSSPNPPGVITRSRCATHHHYWRLVSSIRENPCPSVANSAC